MRGLGATLPHGNVAWANTVGDVETVNWHFPSFESSLQFTVETMKDYAVIRRSDPRIRQLAASVAKLCEPRDGACQASALLAWVRYWMHFLADPGHELIQDPIITLRLGVGDCDDLSVLYATIAEAMGLNAAYVTGSPIATSSLPRHVLPAVGANGRWIPAEVCHPSLPFGTWPPDFEIHRIYPIPP